MKETEIAARIVKAMPDLLRDFVAAELRELVEANQALLAELGTARDEMNRQACLYAEASRHRAELRARLNMLEGKDTCDLEEARAEAQKERRARGE